ncbi:DUF4297 family anti-phage-associated protein [Agrobacterium tumefaciens]|uniref:DUF4297 family anti-phage-associated protein n=1 Tax=Agrobacterium tumefaciens TaxID=358 RepID=UPI003B9F353B
MATRSADSTILGYFYQFDHSILQILSMGSNSSKMVVEGVEDVDLTENHQSLFIQCKYYKGSDYNHSIIKDAVIAMLKHFAAKGCPADGSLKYRLYGHYRSGQDKLPPTYDIDFLKKHFLTFTKTGKDNVKSTTEIFDDLGLTDAQLETFRQHLQIDLYAKSYESQQEEVSNLIRGSISGASREDTAAFFYPNAINIIQQLAVDPKEENRGITKGDFIAKMDRKKAIFSLWLKAKFDEDHYAKSLRREHFTFQTKVPTAWRIIALEFGTSFDLQASVLMLADIASKLSHRESTRMAASDRFCPYVLLRNVEPSDLAALKNALWNRGIRLADGHAFLGADFDPAYLATLPHAGNVITLKFMSSEDDIVEVAKFHRGVQTDIFDFYVATPIASNIPSWVQHHQIKVDSPLLARKAICK